MNSSDAKTIRFFCNEYDELKSLCSDNNITDYKQNQMSAIMRRMLFDEKSYIIDVKKLLNQQDPVYVCIPYISFGHPNLIFGSVNDGFFPGNDTTDTTNAVMTSGRQLGKQNIIEYRGNTYTVKELVKYIANKDGAVHFDQKLVDTSGENLKELQDEIWVGGRPAITSSLRSIGLVLLAGLKDIREAANN